MIIGIFDWANRFIDETNTVNGGSETWLIEITKELGLLGHKVHLFCNCKFHNNGNVTFIPKSKFKEITSIVEYDKFIYSRGFNNINAVNAKEIDLMLHDEVCFDVSVEALNKVKYIFLLSKHSMEKFSALYGKNYENKYKLTFNGIDQSLYKECKKENMMVWSSRPERGYSFFANKVFPLIKAAIPDFIVNVCSYDTANIPVKSGIVFKGLLNKKQLADLQERAKIWCYPNLGYMSNGIEFNETFCITAVENAFANNNIVCGCNGGLTTTLPEEILVGKEFFKNKRCINENEYAKYLADLCIKVLKNEIELKCDVSKYTWKNAALSLL